MRGLGLRLGTASGHPQLSGGSSSRGILRGLVAGYNRIERCIYIYIHLFICGLHALQGMINMYIYIYIYPYLCFYGNSCDWAFEDLGWRV